MVHFLVMLIILGSVYVFFSLLFAMAYFNEKNCDLKKLMIAFLMVSPGIILICVPYYIKQGIPKNVSESCGTVKQYAIHAKGKSSFDSLDIIDEKTGSIHYLTYDAKQPRLEKNQYVCFKFYDAFRNAIGLSQLIEIKPLVKDFSEKR